MSYECYIIASLGPKLWTKTRIKIVGRHFVILTDKIDSGPGFFYKTRLLLCALPPLKVCKPDTETYSWKTYFTSHTFSIFAITCTQTALNHTLHISECSWHYIRTVCNAIDQNIVHFQCFGYRNLISHKAR